MLSQQVLIKKKWKKEVTRSQWKWLKRDGKRKKDNMSQKPGRREGGVDSVKFYRDGVRIGLKDDKQINNEEIFSNEVETKARLQRNDITVEGQINEG